jgi:beta-lactamase regulating signal transducer with metallopeptidase domain
VSIVNAVAGMAHHPEAQAVGWALLHFVWQGALIGAITAVILWLLRTTAPDVRYVVSTIGLSVMFTMPVVTGVQLWRASVSGPGPSAAQALHVDSATVAPTPAPPPLNAAVRPASERDAPAPSGRGLDAWMPSLVLGWLVGVVVLTMRLMSGWLWVQRMKSYGTAPVAEQWQTTALSLARRLHIGTPVRLLESTLVDVPTVIGWLKPVMLLPVSALAGLAPSQLEAIFAHELAHVRRHDYLVNLLQTVVETLLFYHPAVWWLSSRIRAERENCCDDLAVALCGDRVAYARALADLEELRGTGGRLVLAANGASLVQRIRRLLGAPTHTENTPAWLAGGLALVLLSGIALGAVGTETFRGAAAVRAVPAPVEPAPRVPAPLVPAGAGPSFAREAAVQSRAEVLAVTEAAPPPSRDDSPVVVPSGPAAVKTEPVLAARGFAFAFTETAAVGPQPAVRNFPVVAAGSGAPPAVAEAHQSHRTFSWSNDGEKLDVKYDGEAEFTDDGTDVKRLSPDGSLRLKDGWMFPAHTVDFSVDKDGNIIRRYWAGMSERPFDPEGRQWLAQVLPRFIRQTGIGAPARVRRILAAKGPAGVLAEIALIDGGFAKKIYYTELLKSATLDPAMVRQVLAQASREIASDFELASLLIDCADKLMVDEPTRQAYFEAAGTIDSDFEMHRVYSNVLKRGALTPPALAALLASSHKIDSDFEEATLLVDVAKLQSFDSTTRPAFFAALETVGSDFERHRVLTAVAARPDLSPETAAAALMSAASIQSDFEAASFLADLAARQRIEGPIRAPFFHALDSVDSSFERSRVLQAVASRPDASPDTVMAALHSAAGISGGFERSNVLLAIARTHTLEGQARDAYVDAAEKLGEFEQGQVLAALVKAERRK